MSQTSTVNLKTTIAAINILWHPRFLSKAARKSLK